MTKPRNPFQVLEHLRETLPEGNSGIPANNSTAESDPAPEPRNIARAVVRIERKGRRGKEATVIEKLALPDSELEIWCRELKHALGCGGTVDGNAIVLQGDLRSRLEALLIARGVAKVTIA